MTNRIHVAIKSLNELGFTPMYWLLIYRLGLYSGFWRSKTPAQQEYPDYLASIRTKHESNDFLSAFPFHAPSKDVLLHRTEHPAQQIIAEANEIVEGKIRYFSDQASSFDWQTGSSEAHWTDYEMHRASYTGDDVKIVWEPGRFSWAYTLCRAFIITGNEKYLHSFWQHTTGFLEHHPPNCGPQWTSAQEVALRLLALLFADQIFSTSSAWSRQQHETIINAVIAHARRIMPTISYARAQNNNHLLTEALGLYAAGVSLPFWPESINWRNTGWDLINEVIQNQIADDGTYTQHSTNYHRLMLQALTWTAIICKSNRQTFSPAKKTRIVAAIDWLFTQMDPISGKVPNLGHNDGAYLFPLASGGYSDYRPVLQAASLAFCDAPNLPSGPWDELSLWAGLNPDSHSQGIHPVKSSQAVHRLGDDQCWGTLRAVQFHQRPAHADQLHVDLWWQGMNIAMDAGTFSYNSPAPWNNSLKHTGIHNTVTIEDKNQMTSAGRFLWLDWAQARIIEEDLQKKCITAEHNGYRSNDIIHRRQLSYPEPMKWLVTDEIISLKGKSHCVSARVHWLLPDYPWKIDNTSLEINTPGGMINLSIEALAGENGILPEISSIQLIRAGEVLMGPSNHAVQNGWYSPTYYSKQPALSFSITFSAKPPFSMKSAWKLAPHQT